MQNCVNVPFNYNSTSEHLNALLFGVAHQGEAIKKQKNIKKLNKYYIIFFFNLSIKSIIFVVLFPYRLIFRLICAKKRLIVQSRLTSLNESGIRRKDSEKDAHQY